jgi:hypothetical protein
MHVWFCRRDEQQVARTGNSVQGVDDTVLGFDLFPAGIDEALAVQVDGLARQVLTDQFRKGVP